LCGEIVHGAVGHVLVGGPALALELRLDGVLVAGDDFLVVVGEPDVPGDDRPDDGEHNQKTDYSALGNACS
jgi:hypothetical protein